MTTQFTGKVVLVTGGGSGIGRACARTFARAGATVVVAGRGAEPLARTVELIEGDGGHADAITVDITRAGGIEHLIATAAGRHGGLHVAVNNAGVFAGGAVADLDEESWSRVLDTNLTGTWLAMKHEINHMRQHGGGAIVNVASNLGAHMRIPGISAYIAAKAGVSALTRAAALEYIGDGIRINAVSPGPVDTPMSLLPGETAEGRAERMKTALPIGRVATVDELANTIAWLAGEQASYLVGHDLLVDGGAAA
ncbi:SDR family NAD(P)-dependent oxidoreductase [Actinophytocola gossypii]|uniref:SDR family oxidoreductase n=1 Tax=Actinophytocola gossypii TaxID=2812003 RepID=A0ABT2JJG0_9PSEU|nr:SDR family oxidoreductase [Actinophytocola gossypii]MCT2588028.1 SDR family oxidoreductase [Actinophytocola gossypii]